MTKKLKQTYVEPDATMYSETFRHTLMANSFGINDLEEDNSYTDNPYYVL